MWDERLLWKFFKGMPKKYFPAKTKEASKSHLATEWKRRENADTVIEIKIKIFYCRVFDFVLVQIQFA